MLTFQSIGGCLECTRREVVLQNSCNWTVCGEKGARNARDMEKYIENISKVEYLRQRVTDETNFYSFRYSRQLRENLEINFYKTNLHQNNE